METVATQSFWRLKALPGHDVHFFVDRVCFGKVYRRMHREMDWPVYYVKRNHRRYFHDPASVYLIASRCYPGDQNAITSGFMHLQIDKTCTRDPAYRAQRRSFLQNLTLKRGKAEKREEAVYSKGIQGSRGVL